MHLLDGRRGIRPGAFDLLLECFDVAM